MILTPRQRLAHVLRKLHLLQAADTLLFLSSYWQSRAPNSRFRAQHPGVPVPPAAVLYDIQGNCDLEGFYRSGLQHAAEIARLIERDAPPGPLKVLEWGCGPARVLQHLTSPSGAAWDLCGSDYNPDTIDWCRKSLPGIHFAHNGLKPPIPLESESVDVLYCISVFTHLSEESHREWIDEVRRLLKPGGLFIGTFHGDAFRDQLTSDERRRYDAGELVTRGNITEGKKNYSAYHGDDAVRRLLSGFSSIRKETMQGGFYQTVWTCVKGPM